MAKFLVVDFNRYDTDKSKHVHVEADTPLQAIVDSMELDTDEAEEVLEDFSDLIIHTDEIFSSVAGEENDFLVYLV